MRFHRYLCIIWLLLPALALSACAAPAPATVTTAPSAAPTLAVIHTPALQPTTTPQPSETSTPYPTLTPDYPPQGYGPAGFPAGINPLTGLEADETLLDRRPLLIKVENLPRNHRPQFGLNRADLVWEYYTEEGSTRFAALFYGQDSPQVAPIRSARWFDMNLVRMYKSVLVYGGAYQRLWDALVSSDFGTRLVVEGFGSCPALCRYDPNGDNLLSANTVEMRAYLQQRNIDNTRQNLEGMLFQAQTPEGGLPAGQVFTRFSGAIYNRWDYDDESGSYLRLAETQDDLNGTNEVYAPLTDRIDGAQIAANNVVVILAQYFRPDPNASTEVVDVALSGSGQAYLFRDGQGFAVRWQRETASSVLSLVDAEGRPVAFKPGNTWFEVMGESSSVTPGDAWRFRHVFP